MLAVRGNGHKPKPPPRCPLRYSNIRAGGIASVGGSSALTVDTASQEPGNQLEVSISRSMTVVPPNISARIEKAWGTVH